MSTKPPPKEPLEYTQNRARKQARKAQNRAHVPRPEFDPYFVEPAPGTIEDVDANNATWPDFLERASKAGDRTEAIMLAIAAEQILDAFLAVWMPGWPVLASARNANVTFSLKISLLRASQLVPPTLPDALDALRMCRNAFAHRHDAETYAQLSADEVRGLRSSYARTWGTYVHGDGQPVEGAETRSTADLFRDAFTFVQVFLPRYQRSAEHLRTATWDPAFREQLMLRGREELVRSVHKRIGR